MTPYSCYNIANETDCIMILGCNAMAKYTGVTQNKDGLWSYRIKMKVDGRVIVTKIKKDNSGMPFLTARACYETKIKHEADYESDCQRRG